MDEEQDIWFDMVELDKPLRNKLWEIIVVELDGIMNDFYDKLLVSRYGALLEGVNIENLIVRQKKHWERMVLQGHDEEYKASVERMHSHHHAIGLDNSLYIRAYLYFLKRLYQVIILSAAGPNEATKLVSALQVIVSDDMSGSLEVSWSEFEENSNPSSII